MRHSSFSCVLTALLSCSAGLYYGSSKTTTSVTACEDRLNDIHYYVQSLHLQSFIHLYPLIQSKNIQLRQDAILGAMDIMIEELDAQEMKEQVYADKVKIILMDAKTFRKEHPLSKEVLN